MSGTPKPTGETCPKCGNDKLVFRLENAHPKFAACRTCRCCGNAFVVPEPPPSSVVPAGEAPRDAAERLLARLRHREAQMRADGLDPATDDAMVSVSCADLRALASSSSAIREAATEVLHLFDRAYVGAYTASGHTAFEALRAALSSSGASPTDTNPTTDA